MLLASKMFCFAQYVVKFAILGSGQECGDLCLSVEQDRAYREPRVPHGDLAARERGQLHACPVGIAVLALLPANLAEFAGRHAVVHHGRSLPFRQSQRTRTQRKFTRCNPELASGKQMSGFVSTVWWLPVRLFGDLCTVRMNVHLALHLHILSGSMSLSTQLTP